MTPKTKDKTKKTPKTKNCKRTQEKNKNTEMRPKTENTKKIPKMKKLTTTPKTEDITKMTLRQQMKDITISIVNYLDQWNTLRVTTMIKSKKRSQIHHSEQASVKRMSAA